LSCVAAENSDQPAPTEGKKVPREEMPTTAKSEEEIKKAVDARKGFGHVSTKKFTPAGREIIVLSYCPFSGRDASYVHGYSRDKPDGGWTLFWNRLIEHSHTVTVELSKDDKTLVVKNTSGDEVLSQAIDKLSATKEDQPAEKK
jgi:hypothetical protein